MRKTPDDVVAEIGRIRAERDVAGARTRIEVGLSTAFGCTLPGPVALSEAMRLLQAVLNAGADSVGLADTVGYADPCMVRELFETSIDFDALVALRAQLAAWLAGESLHGNIWKAGLPRTLRQSTPQGATS